MREHSGISGLTLPAAAQCGLPMTTIVSHVLAPGVQPADMWRAVAQATHAWLDEQHLAVADAVVLLPFADLLTPARRAFAERSLWMPRLHTARTLAAALGPPVARAAGELTGDGAIDRVTARELLRKQAWAREWHQRDAHGFDCGPAAPRSHGTCAAQACRCDGARGARGVVRACAQAGRRRQRHRCDAALAAATGNRVGRAGGRRRHRPLVCTQAIGLGGVDVGRRRRVHGPLAEPRRRRRRAGAGVVGRPGRDRPVRCVARTLHADDRGRRRCRRRGDGRGRAGGAALA